MGTPEHYFSIPVGFPLVPPHTGTFYPHTGLYNFYHNRLIDVRYSLDAYYSRGDVNYQQLFMNFRSKFRCLPHWNQPPWFHAI